jgi:hypothetical protein
MAAKEFVYYPTFDQQAAKPVPMPPVQEPPKAKPAASEESETYYLYDAGNAGRLASAAPQYIQGYYPQLVFPNVFYHPPYKTPNVPMSYLNTFNVPKKKKKRKEKKKNHEFMNQDC